MRYFLVSLTGIGLILIGSCKKFLDANPNPNSIIPTTILHLQALLDNAPIMNGNSTDGIGVDPSLGEAGCDDLYLLNLPLSPNTLAWKNIYIWNDTIYSVDLKDWQYPYRVVYYANLVLEGLAAIHPTAAEQKKYDNAKGSAFFFKAIMYYQLLQVFAPAFDRVTSKTDWGIVIKTSSDIYDKAPRSTVQACYDTIIHHLKAAACLLPNKPMDDVKTRPSKAAVYGLLARTYLTMRIYDSALVYADSCLGVQHSLMDFNDATQIHYTELYPIQRYNAEVIFHSCMIQTNISPLFNSARHRVDTVLFKQFDTNDLRRLVYFSPQAQGYSFKGSYDGSEVFFTGIAVDEILLIRAECYARKGWATKAMNELNALLEKRWKSGTFTPLTVTDANEALAKIVVERRKELVFRGLRWSDIKRFNKENATIYIIRTIEGEKIILEPNSPHYAILIPPDILLLNPGMPQNPR